MRHGTPYHAYKKPKAARRRLRRYLFIMAFLLLVVAVIYTASFVSMLQSFHNKAAWAQDLRAQGPAGSDTYLIYGVDYWGARPYVERLLLLHYDLASSRTMLVFIPGNTLIPTGGEDGLALGQVYRYEQNPQFIYQVQDFLGLPVNHYLGLHYQGFVRLADRLGGVKAGELAGAPAGFLPAAKDYLDGFELYRYFLTPDHHETHLEHLERQRQLLLAIWRQVEVARPWQWPALFRAISPYLETDLSWRELRELRARFADIPFDRVQVLQLPGETKIINGFAYWVSAPGEVHKMIQALGEGFLAAPGEIRVEVLNGSGLPGLASQMAALLENEGYQVVRTGNAERTDYRQTEVIALGEPMIKARAVSLFIPGSLLKQQLDPHAGADVRVIVGLDFAEKQAEVEGLSP